MTLDIQNMLWSTNIFHKKLISDFDTKKPR